MDLLSVSPYQEVFSRKRQQKRAKIGAMDLEGLMEAAEKRAEGYSSSNDRQALLDASGQEAKEEATPGRHFGEEIFNKGTSRRIWAELYKVVDAADVLVFVLDARDPMGTRCQQLERELRKSRRHKHVVLLVNKVDLVPTWVTRRWVQELTRDFPTLAFHASITNPFGKNALLNLLRQFGNLLKEKKHVTVGMIGYPNVGKSSVINTLKRKKVCKAAPVPGETRVWQYIALTKRIYLLDCPGIVPPSQSDFAADCAKVLKGVVRAERLKTPSDYIHEVLERVKKPYLLQRYRLPADTAWNDSEEFLTILGKKMGKLVKGGEADLDTAARIVLYDWQRGRIPYFTPPPQREGEEEVRSSPGSPSSL
ncbi:Gnl2 [Symbiodinium natans]|uniref:Gnl2 protein n=1 Tax=Symbiodinium natans TaxID=878477 RepID=A0A812J518_9DINO|nr:Gnl2 [Symbiodinium natans]